jgi:hypothetical protein
VLGRQGPARPRPLARRGVGAEHDQVPRQVATWRDEHALGDLLQLRRHVTGAEHGGYAGLAGQQQAELRQPGGLARNAVLADDCDGGRDDPVGGEAGRRDVVAALRGRVRG